MKWLIILVCILSCETNTDVFEEADGLYRITPVGDQYESMYINGVLFDESKPVNIQSGDTIVFIYDSRPDSNDVYLEIGWKKEVIFTFKGKTDYQYFEGILK